MEGLFTKEFFIFYLLAIFAFMAWSFWRAQEKSGLTAPQIYIFFAIATVFLLLFPPIIFNDSDLLMFPMTAICLFSGFVLLVYPRKIVEIRGKGLSPTWISLLTVMYRVLGAVFFIIGLVLLFGTIVILLEIGEP
jgi:hypothetical protein